MTPSNTSNLRLVASSTASGACGARLALSLSESSGEKKRQHNILYVRYVMRGSW